MKNPARKKSVQSGDFRRKHAVVHVSAIMHILPGYRVLIFGGYFRGIAADSKFQEKMKGYLFSEGYLFTGFYGNLKLMHLWRQRAHTHTQTFNNVARSPTGLPPRLGQ